MNKILGDLSMRQLVCSDARVEPFALDVLLTRGDLEKIINEADGEGFLELDVTAAERPPAAAL